MSHSQAPFINCPRCGKRKTYRADRPKHCADCLGDDSVAQPWMQHAACTNPLFDPEWWFSETENAAVAMTVCRYCKVRDLCADFAIQHNVNDGIWGGLTSNQRREIKALKRRSA